MEGDMRGLKRQWEPRSPAPQLLTVPSRHPELLEATNLTLNPLLFSQLVQAALIAASSLFSQRFDLITRAAFITLGHVCRKHP